MDKFRALALITISAIALTGCLGTPTLECKLLDLQGNQFICDGEIASGIVRHELENGKVLEMELKNGLPNGTSKLWYPNGNLETVSEMVDGVKHGKAVGYHENGELWFRVEYKNGQLSGEATLFDTNGNIVAE